MSSVCGLLAENRQTKLKCFEVWKRFKNVLFFCDISVKNGKTKLILLQCSSFKLFYNNVSFGENKS
jgi:hypothetical protein